MNNNQHEKGELNIIYINIRSIKNKLNDLNTIIKTYKQTIHIIIVSETWLNENETQFYNIQQYESFHSTRSTPAGGVTIYIHKAIKSSIIYNDTTNFNNILGIQIQINKKKMQIFGIYKQPQSDLTHFLTHLETTLRTFTNSIYFGDFNINILKDSNTMRQYMDMVYSNGYIILNKIDNQHITRINNTDGGTIIDHILTDNISSNNTYTIALNDTFISDHRFIHATINQRKPKQTTPTHTTHVIEYHKISSIEINNIQNSATFEEFIDKIKGTITQYTKTIINSAKAKQITPWIRKETMDKIKIRDDYFKLKIKYPNNLYYNERFKYYRNITNTLIKNNKQNYYANKYQNNINNKKRFWDITNEILFNKTQSINTQITIKKHNIEINNPRAVADEFNNFFTYTNTSNQQIININNRTHAKANFNLYPTTTNEIINIIKSLNESSATGYDGIPTKFIKLFDNQLASRLSLLINETFKNATYPDCLKIARISPIHKAGKKTKLVTIDQYQYYHPSRK